MSAHKLGCREEGFTLVELSIVIIIIGLLISGITVGTSIIKNSELAAIASDLKSYQSAYVNFAQRYYGTPGDITNGASLWPSTSTTPCGETDANCIGNGDGKINTALEGRAAWRELALAGMISANIQTVATSATTASIASSIAGTMPASKSIGVGYSMVNGAEAVYYDTNSYSGKTGLWGTGDPTSSKGNTVVNAVLMGKVYANNQFLTGAAYSPQDAYSLDIKMDDGAASSGLLRAGDGADMAAHSCLNLDGTYLLSSNSTACIIGFAMNDE